MHIGSLEPGWPASRSWGADHIRWLRLRRGPDKREGTCTASNTGPPRATCPRPMTMPTALTGPPPRLVPASAGSFGLEPGALLPESRLGDRRPAAGRAHEAGAGRDQVPWTGRVVGGAG